MHCELKVNSACRPPNPRKHRPSSHLASPPTERGLCSHPKYLTSCHQWHHLWFRKHAVVSVGMQYLLNCNRVCRASMAMARGIAASIFAVTSGSTRHCHWPAACSVTIKPTCAAHLLRYWLNERLQGIDGHGAWHHRQHLCSRLWQHACQNALPVVLLHVLWRARASTPLALSGMGSRHRAGLAALKHRA